LENDLIGIGPGPANLSLAALLTTAREGGRTSITGNFFERETTVFWHSLQMFPGAGSGPRLVALLHHTDAKREWAYDRHSKVGRLDKALDSAEANDWTIVDMATDWNTVFPRTGS
jgi:hypothetical protein